MTFNIKLALKQMLVGFFDISVSIPAELKYANQCMRASKLKLCLCNITIKPDKHKSKHKKKCSK